MTAWRSLAALLLVPAALAALLAAQQGRGVRRWQQYEAEMQDPADDPPDAWEKTEFAFARLRYRSGRDAFGGGYGGGFRGRYARWGTDANKSERQFIMGLRRLTRVHARSVEEIVDIDSDGIFDWPWLYAVGIGDWRLSESHVERLKRYFERGGFFVVDDFHNEAEWARFAAGVSLLFPGREFIELDDDAKIFHSVYDLSKREHVPGFQVTWGQPWERGGVGAHWRAMLDDKGRVMIAAFFNQDLGDAWEWADHPQYPEQHASMAYKMGVNYVIYAMTH
jgi:hypothetical protein